MFTCLDSMKCDKSTFNLFMFLFLHEQNSQKLYYPIKKKVSPFTFTVWIALIIHEIEQKMVKITQNLLVFPCNFVFDFCLSLKIFLFEGTLMGKKNVEQNCYEIKKILFTLIRALFFDSWNFLLSRLNFFFFSIILSFRVMSLFQ